MARIWITRTEPGASQTGETVRALGHEACMAPLVEVRPVSDIPQPPPPDAVLMFTSKNGVHAFVAETTDRHWPVITVGDATADLVYQSGFEDVRSAGGTSADVIDRVKADFACDQRPFIHISGAIIRGDITGELAKAGFLTRRDIYYETVAVKNLPAMNLSHLTHVLLHSPFAAKTLRDLSPDLGHVISIAISPDTDRHLTGLSLKARWVAGRPTEASMLSLLDCAPDKALHSPHD